jgi:hypothetical protein
MSAQTFVPLLFGGVLAVYAGIALVTWRRTRGRRVVKCPETRKLAAVELDTRHAIVTALWESADLRVKNCSRWPEHEKCNQACLGEAAGAPPVAKA